MAGRAIGRGKRHSAGFTLHELMIAIGVLLVAVLGTFSSHLVSQNLVSTTRETDAATTDLQAAMEQILLRSPDQIPIVGSPFRANQPIVAFNNLHLRNEQLVPSYPGYAGGAAVPDPLQIVLTATWTDFKGRPRSMRIASLRTR